MGPLIKPKWALVLPEGGPACLKLSLIELTGPLMKPGVTTNLPKGPQACLKGPAIKTVGPLIKAEGPLNKA